MGKEVPKKSEKIEGLEENLEKLEQVVSELEEGELNLQSSIDKFEEGIKLYKNCKEYLETAEKKISVLTDSLKEVEYKE